MTASVLKQDPNIEKVKKGTAFIRTKTQHSNFSVNWTEHENSIAQPKPDKYLSSTSHCSPFNCC